MKTLSVFVLALVGGGCIAGGYWWSGIISVAVAATVLFWPKNEEENKTDYTDEEIHDTVNHQSGCHCGVLGNDIDDYDIEHDDIYPFETEGGLDPDGELFDLDDDLDLELGDDDDFDLDLDDDDGYDGAKSDLDLDDENVLTSSAAIEEDFKAWSEEDSPIIADIKKEEVAMDQEPEPPYVESLVDSDSGTGY
ncbi:hypothetical protein ACFL08_02980 [Patescibacteria group bacterium]